MRGRITATGPGHRLEFERELPAPVERVWHLLTDAEERAAWMIGGTLEPRVDGIVDLVDEHHHVTGRVTRCEPPHLLVLTWSSADAPQGEVRFELTTLTEQTCRLRLVHTLGPGAQVRSLGAGWHRLLNHLGALAEDKPPAGPSFADLVVLYQDVPVERDQA